MNTQLLSLVLAIVGIIGIITFIILAAFISWRYRGGGMYTFRWHWRNTHMRQLLVIASLFFLAMAASYGILRDAWGFLYFMAAVKTGTWWFRLAVTQHG